MTKRRIAEVRNDLYRLMDALNPGSPRFAVSRAVEKLDAILDSLPAEPRDVRVDQNLAWHDEGCVKRYGAVANSPCECELRRAARTDEPSEESGEVVGDVGAAICPRCDMRFLPSIELVERIRAAARTDEPPEDRYTADGHKIWTCTCGQVNYLPSDTICVVCGLPERTT